ncbi:hypothetical protein ABT392_22440 [Paucibacter sp. JuS9]|uniref:hypothetical protein n=1 Tax=Paucibacter sp. JuS9 TaxID=3228748 RepID=UPI00375810EA
MRPILLLLPAALALSACAPWPHQVQLRPEIRGQVLALPGQGVELFLSTQPAHSKPCEAPGEPVALSSEGRFSLPRRSRMELFYAFLVPPELQTSLTGLCLRRAGQPAELAALIGQRGDRAGREVVVRCDLRGEPPRSRGNAQAQLLGQNPAICSAEQATSP